MNFPLNPVEERRVAEVFKRALLLLKHNIHLENTRLLILSIASHRIAWRRVASHRNCMASCCTRLDNPFHCVRSVPFRYGLVLWDAEFLSLSQCCLHRAIQSCSTERNTDQNTVYCMRTVESFILLIPTCRRGGVQENQFSQRAIIRSQQ